MFMIWTLACAVAPNWSAFLIFRFFTGSFASAPNALVAGILSDIYGDPRSRGRAMAWFMAVSRTFYVSPLVLDANGSSSDYRMGPPLRPDYIGLLFDHHRVEVDVLDRLDICRDDFYPCATAA